MKKYLIGVFLLISFIVSVLLYSTTPGPILNTTDQIRFVSLGDSYTIGQGVPSDESWPVQLVQKLQDKDVKITLVANPSVTGWTARDVLDKELTVYDESDPDFATLLIGANDWVQGDDEDTFRKNIKYIIDRMQKKLPNKQNIILITIPDFSVTPTGKRYDIDGNASIGIARFNTIIKEEGKLRNLPVVDIYPITQKMKYDQELINPDGLHPSGKEYKLWADAIFPVALKMLKN